MERWKNRIDRNLCIHLSGFLPFGSKISKPLIFLFVHTCLYGLRPQGWLLCRFCSRRRDSEASVAPAGVVWAPHSLNLGALHVGIVVYQCSYVCARIHCVIPQDPCPESGWMMLLVRQHLISSQGNLFPPFFLFENSQLAHLCLYMYISICSLCSSTSNAASRFEHGTEPHLVSVCRKAATFTFGDVATFF